MKIHGYDKEIVQLRFRYNSKGSYDILEVKNYYFSQDTIIELTNTKRTLNKTPISSIPDNGVLYFDKSCTFPRYKLEGTDYTRCIKIEKADYIIISKNIENNVYRDWRTYTVFEYGDKLYIGEGSSEKHKYLLSIQYPGNKIIYTGFICAYKKDCQLLLQNINKPIIIDEDLDKKINNLLPTLTEDDCQQIVSMMSSLDGSTVDLGIKLLTSFNISATPFTAKTILCLNNNWVNRNVANQVAVETMLATLKLDKNQARYAMRALLSDSTNYSDADKNLAQCILKPSLEGYLKERIKNEILTVQNKYGLTVKITVE